MTNSEILFSKPSVLKWLIALFAGISFVGFLDSTYLTAQHYLGAPLPCSILVGCEEVTTSQYATIGPIPVALFGVVYYLAILLLTIAYIDTKKNSIIRFAAWLTPIGFLASVWFLYLQIFEIKAICLYCVISAITSSLLFVMGLLILVKTQVKK